MNWVAAAATQFFERDASEERKARLRNNLAKLPADASPDQAFLAQAPTRFYDWRTDMGPLYAGAVVRPALLGHLMGALTNDWDITREAGSLRLPILLTHGRYDYTVPYILWDGIELPMASRRTFSRSGHQPFFEEPDEFAEALADWIMNPDARFEGAVEPLSALPPSSG